MKPWFPRRPSGSVACVMATAAAWLACLFPTPLPWPLAPVVASRGADEEGSSSSPSPAAPSPDEAAAGEEGNDVVEAIVRLGTCTRFLAALRAADRVNALRQRQQPGTRTVFVPEDAAFDKLPAGTLEDLLRPENAARLAALVDFHVVPGRSLLAEDFRSGDRLVTLSGASLEVVRSAGGAGGGDGGPAVNGARLVRADVPAVNGTVHVIDQVLLPPAW